MAINAAVKVDRIDPTNWFVGMKNPSLQLMVYGEGIRSAEVSTDYPGVKVDSLVRLDSPNYLLVYLNLDGAQPGEMTLQFKNGKSSKKVKYQLKAREMRGEERMGFTNADVLYMLMPDRFADGDPKNNDIKGMNAYKTDRTQPSLLKMFRMSGPSNFVKNFKELRVTPVSISYEWEPCDALKTNELYQKSFGEYVKTPAADMQSMLEGLTAYKGRVNFAITPPLDEELDDLEDKDNHGDRINEVAAIIDERVHKNFKLWPNNYIAYDLVHGSNKFADKYGDEEKARFIQMMTQKLDKLPGNRSVLNGIFLDIYANPVRNSLLQ